MARRELLSEYDKARITLALELFYVRRTVITGEELVRSLHQQDVQDDQGRSLTFSRGVYTSLAALHRKLSRLGLCREDWAVVYSFVTLKGTHAFGCECFRCGGRWDPWTERAEEDLEQATA